MHSTLLKHLERHTISEHNNIFFDNPELKDYLLCEEKDEELSSSVVQMSVSELQGSVATHIVGAHIILKDMTSEEHQMLKNYIVKPQKATTSKGMIDYYSLPIKAWINRILETLGSTADSSDIVKVLN